MFDIKKSLRCAKAEKNMTAKEISKKTGLTDSQISQIQTGKLGNPGIKTLMMLATALEMEVSQFCKMGESK